MLITYSRSYMYMYLHVHVYMYVHVHVYQFIGENAISIIGCLNHSFESPDFY